MTTTTDPAVVLASQRRKAKRRRIELRGQPATIPSAAVHAHLDALTADGWPINRIAAAAQVGDRALYERRPTIGRRDAARILAVTRDSLFAAATDIERVPAIGTRRRLQALQAIGWSARRIGEETGIGHGAVISRYMRPDRRFVSAQTHRRVQYAYDRLSMTAGANAKTRRAALAAGWPVPLCWDDDTIDHPDAVPYQAPADVQHLERIALVNQLFAEGLTAQAIADRLGIARRTVFRDRDSTPLQATG